MGFPLDLVIIFLVTICVSLFLDLWAHRNAEEISLKGSAAWSMFWIALSMCFYGYIIFRFPEHPEYASEFLAGYVLEKTLSVDNLMVFIAIFNYFNVRDTLQHRILYYGILGALAFRLIFVALGSALMVAGPYADLLFALIIGYSAIKMLLAGDEDEELEDFSTHRVVKFAQKLFHVFPRHHGKQFFIDGDQARALARDDDTITLSGTEKVARYATPALVCLMVIEASDVMFAFDSVPAVIAVTREPMLVYAAMIFAILGLRSLYFVLAALAKHLIYLEKAVILLLFFIATKLGLHASKKLLGWPDFEISANASLIIIMVILGLGVLASIIFKPKSDEDAAIDAD
jgi:tellurite resistance protein TerC